MRHHVAVVCGFFQSPSSHDSEVCSEAIVLIIFAGCSLLPFLRQHSVMVGKRGRCYLPSFPYLLLTETLGLHST